MPRLESLLVANSFAFDRGTGRLSIFDVLNEIWPQKFPAVLMGAAVISIWLFEQGEKGSDYQFTSLVKPPGLPGLTINHNLTVTKTRQIVINISTGIPVPQAGNIEYELRFQGQKLGAFETRVNEPDPAVNRQPDPLLLYPGRMVAQQGAVEFDL